MCHIGVFKYLEESGMRDDISSVLGSSVGSLFGLAFSTYFKSTRIGLWMYAKFDLIVDFLVERWGWTWFKQDEDAWSKKYTYVTKKIEELEKRIKKLEK